MKKLFSILITIFILFQQNLAFGVEDVPRITDREIVEGLTGIRGDIKSLEGGLNKIEEDMKVLDKSLNKRIDDLRSEVNSRFNTIQWMLGLFITIALIILGFVLRMQWQMQRRQTQMETILEVQKSELTFIKGLIEKLLPHKGSL